MYSWRFVCGLGHAYVLLLLAVCTKNPAIKVGACLELIGTGAAYGASVPDPVGASTDSLLPCTSLSYLG